MILCTYLCTVARDRLQMHYGLPSARERRNREKTAELTDIQEFNRIDYKIYFILSAVFFFGTPSSYLMQIINVYRGRVFQEDGVNVNRWRPFLQSILKDWMDSNLLVSCGLFSIGA